MSSLLVGFWDQHVTDAGLLAIALVALASNLICLGIMAWRHRRNLRAVPLRIHVAGTRGKSTATRMIAAGLRAGGHRVVAKATGSQPRFILPDGTEEVWPRRGPASIREQAKFFARAARLGAQAAVVECMAIRPELIWASEAHFVRANTAIITNARADHFEEIGDKPEAMLDALRWVVPLGGSLVVAAEAATPALRSWAASRGAEVSIVDTSGLAPLDANRALALAVCAVHGVPPDIAGPAMDRADADPGAYREYDLEIGGKTVRFANAFSCNDVDSLARLWANTQHAAPPIVILNARRDRPLRTKHFIDFLAAQRPVPVLFVVGDRLALFLARRAGFMAGAARWLHARTPGAALAELAAEAPDRGIIWGVGNYQGFGARMVVELAAQPTAC